MARQPKFSPEVRERAVRMVQDHRAGYSSQWEAICSIATKLGCSGEALRTWIRNAEIDSGHRSGVTSDERARPKDLERENRELQRANEILRKASAYFAQAECQETPTRMHVIVGRQRSVLTRGALPTSESVHKVMYLAMTRAFQR